MSGIDVLMLGTHPDDVEISCAGTVLHFVDQGREVVIGVVRRWVKGTLGRAVRRSGVIGCATGVV